MDAPLYPPALAFEPPVIQAYRMTTTNTSIATLLSSPQIKAIMQREIPGYEARIKGDMLAPHLDNFSPRSLVQFGLFKADALDRVDAEILKLPNASGGAR